MKYGMEVNLEEFNKAVETLTSHGVRMIVKPHPAGGAIAILSDIDGCDFTCNPCTYGADEGLLEVYGKALLTEEEAECDDVAGWLNANEVVERVLRATA